MADEKEKDRKDGKEAKSEKERKPEERRGRPKSEHGRRPRLRLHSIKTTRADDGGFVHEHVYKDENGIEHPSRFGGVSSDMEDLHDHMDDHFGEGAEQPGEEEPEQTATDANAAPEGQPPATET